MTTTKPTRVLLVDDHDMVRVGLSALLQHLPNLEIVSSVSDGAAAVEAVRVVEPDLVVLDLSMPTSGFTAMRQIKAERPDVKIVVLTRHREAVSVQEALLSGATGYVLKQSPFSHLEAAIEAACRGERYVDTSLPAAAALADGEGGPRITTRETDILRRASLGHSNKEIAAACDIAVKTVEVHKANAMRKLNLKERSDLLRYAVRRGWLSEL